MGGIGTSLCQRLHQRRLQRHRRLRPEPRSRQMAGRAGGARLSSSMRRWATSATGIRRSRLSRRSRPMHGPVDVLVNNAGITRDGMFRKMTRADWDAVIETNLTSLFNVTKQVIDDMVDQGWGRIINISSVNGEKGQFGQTNYSAAKAGMHGFTMALGAGGGEQRRHRQHRQPGLHRHRHGEVDSPRGARQDRRRHSRAAGSARRRTSPRSSRGSPRTSPASRPVPTSPSTAACTWGEARAARLAVRTNEGARTRGGSPTKVTTLALHIQPGRRPRHVRLGRAPWQTTI